MNGGGENDSQGLKPVPCSECGKSIDGVRRHENHVLQFGVIVCEECSNDDEDVGGVRGAEEIEEKLEELEEKIGTTLVGFHLQDKKEALQWVLGEVDDL